MLLCHNNGKTLFVAHQLEKAAFLSIAGFFLV